MRRTIGHARNVHVSARTGREPKQNRAERPGTPRRDAPPRTRGRARNALDAARTILAPYLVFAGAGARELLRHLLDLSRAKNLSHRNARAGDRERHLLLYLQRVAAKNDTFSEFGPSGWGTITRNISAVTLAPEPGIAKRDAFLERWIAHAIAAAINSDPENSNPKLAVPALEPHAVEVLLRDVENWLPSSIREKWLSMLQALVELPLKFAATSDLQDRQSIIGKAQTSLQSIGAGPKQADRFLYSATNPIGEECFRECHFEINERLIDEVAVQAEPWIDLWRDTYAFIASRVAAGLRGIMEKAGAKSGVMPLPAFMQACEAAKLSLTGPGLVALSVMAFQEVKAAFRKRLQPHVDLSEYELTAEDCHVVRNNFDYPKFDEYTYPSADLQLAATSTEAIARGDYQWILAELHPPPALLHHFAYWHCPDRTGADRALVDTTFGNRIFILVFSRLISLRTRPCVCSTPCRNFQISSRHNEPTPNGKESHRRMRKFMSMKPRATLAFARSTITNISDRSRARGSFRSGFIRSNLESRRTRLVCVAGKLSCSAKTGR